MDTRILTQKHWVIFISFLALTVLAEVVVSFIAHIFNFGWLGRPRQVSEFLLQMPLYFSYPFLIGNALNHRLKGHTKFERLATLHLAIIAGLFFGAYLLRLAVIDTGSAFDLLLWSINVVCWLILFSVPAKQLKSIELKRNAGIWEYVPETFQIICWPLGVWWLQPRLNKIATKHVSISE
jgi:hypothetical protein